MKVFTCNGFEGYLGVVVAKTQHQAAKQLQVRLEVYHNLKVYVDPEQMKALNLRPGVTRILSSTNH